MTVGIIVKNKINKQALLAAFVITAGSLHSAKADFSLKEIKHNLLAHTVDGKALPGNCTGHQSAITAREAEFEKKQKAKKKKKQITESTTRAQEEDEEDKTSEEK